MKYCKCKVLLNPNYNSYYIEKLKLNNHLLLNKISSKDIAVNEIADMIRTMSLKEQ